MFSPVAVHALTAGSYLPVWPTISGGAKLHITNGYFPVAIVFAILGSKKKHTLKKGRYRKTKIKIKKI